MTNRERAEELATAIIAGRMCESFLKLAERLESEFQAAEDYRIAMRWKDIRGRRSTVTP